VTPNRLKRVGKVTACVVDYGTFISVAEKLAETMDQVYYHSPYEVEYQDIRDCVKGTGLDPVERLDDLLDAKHLAEIDLFIFPDIGFTALQKHLRDMGKAVWGHMGANDLELYRGYFLDVLNEVGLPTVNSERITGVTNLEKYLTKNEDKWIKLDRFRANMETWHHADIEQSRRTLDNLAVIFGGAKEHVDFIVQDSIKTDMETGCDSWCIDGQFPPFAFQGYEKKNELYLAAVVSHDDLPDEIKMVNEAMSPILKTYGYRDWWATEIRVSDGVPYFIDPTPRLPGQSGEHQLETISNIAEVIWNGANGIMIEPKFAWKFEAEATLHYDSDTKDPTIVDEWKTLRLPSKVSQWVKLYHYCKMDGAYQFPSRNNDEVGVVLGGGDSVEDAIEHLNENLEALKELPVHANVAGFATLLDSIKQAEKEGIKFGGEIPEPETIFKGKAVAAL
jgi:hypothetical protein